MKLEKIAQLFRWLNTNVDQVISWATGLTTLTIALFSFHLSFNALAALAEEYKISIPQYIPLILEGGVIVFSLNAFWRSLRGLWTGWQWTLIICSSMVAGSFNILHAPANTPSQIMAVLPSFFLLLSFETFLSQVKHMVKLSKTAVTLVQLDAELARRQTEQDQALARRQAEQEAEFNNKSAELDRVITERQRQLDQMIDRLNKLTNQIEQRQAELNTLPTVQRPVRIREDADREVRRQSLLDILSNEGNIGVTELSKRIGAARGTVYSDLQALEQAGQIYQANGSGWKVNGRLN